jgi:Flp pilus assembly pilin Flp
MQNYFIRTKEFLNNEEGSSAAEYAILVSLIAGVIVAAISAFGTKLATYYGNIVSGLTF